MRWQPFALGFLGLVGLEVIVSSPTAVSNFGGLTNGLGNLARKIISPTVPAFGSAKDTTPPGGYQNTPGPSYSQLTPAQQGAINAYMGGAPTTPATPTAPTTPSTSGLLIPTAPTLNQPTPGLFA